MTSLYPNEDERAIKPLLGSQIPLGNYQNEEFIFNESVHKQEVQNQTLRKLIACCMGTTVACFLICICLLVVAGALVLLSGAAVTAYYFFACDALLLNFNVVKNTTSVDTAVLDPTIRFIGEVPGKIYVLPNARAGSTLIEVQFVNYAKRRLGIGMFDYSINRISGKSYEVKITPNANYVASMCFQIDVELLVPVNSVVSVEGPVKGVNLEDADKTGNMIELDSFFLNGSRIDDTRQVLVNVQKVKLLNQLSISDVKNGLITLNTVQANNAIVQTVSDKLVGSISVQNSNIGSTFIYTKNNPIQFTSFTKSNQFIFMKTETGPVTLQVNKNNVFGGVFSLSGNTKNFKIIQNDVIRVATQSESVVSGAIGDTTLGGIVEVQTINSNLLLSQSNK